MNLSEFYSLYSDEQNCIELFKRIYLKRLGSCKKCDSNSLKWYTSFTGWRCKKCSHRMSLKSLTFMRDSNLSFSDWLEIIFLQLQEKKSTSIKEITRLSKQSRYGTVAYAVKKIRAELININTSQTPSKVACINFNLSEDFHGVNSLDTPKIPPTIILHINPSSNRKRDKIHLSLDLKETLIYKRISEFKRDSSSREYRKLLISKRFPVSDKKKMLFIKNSWYKKIKENLIKCIKGVYHQTTLFHLEGILGEYSFKYNNRHHLNSKYLIFLVHSSKLVRQNCVCSM